MARPFGIDFVVVESGNIATGGPAKTAAVLQRVSETMTDGQSALYGNQFLKFAAAMNAMQATRYRPPTPPEG